MKFQLNKSSCLGFLLLFVLAFEGCKKKKEEEIVKIQNIVPQTIIDNLTNKGMSINQGAKPPTLNLAIRVSPYKLLAPYGDEDSYKTGRIIDDYFYKFYGQSASQEITYDFYNNGRSDKGTGQGAFIVGSGNKFTIFSEDIGVGQSIPYKTVSVISGELAGNTIKNFQFAFVIKEKTGDNNNSALIPVEKGRIWIDGDAVSESISNFRVSAVVNGKSETVLSIQ